jgi:hypothetical protein
MITHSDTLTLGRTALDALSANRKGFHLQQHSTLTTDKTPMAPALFEPAIPAREWPQAYALDCITAVNTG